MNRYYWVTGMDGRGAVTTAGPYMTEEEARDATAHLRNTQIHVLKTRQHDKARRILKARMQSGGGEDQSSRMAADEPTPELPRSFGDSFREFVTQSRPREHQD